MCLEKKQQPLNPWGVLILSAMQARLAWPVGLCELVRSPPKMGLKDKPKTKTG